MSSYFGCFPLELGEIIVARQMVDKFDANTLGKLDAKLYYYTTHRKMRNDEKKSHGFATGMIKSINFHSNKCKNTVALSFSLLQSVEIQLLSC